MKWLVRELRDLTGLSQSAFAKEYNIPVSTLRKWEQGEASPAPYVVELLARVIPGAERSMEKIPYRKEIYYYSRARSEVYDAEGNAVRIHVDLDGVKRQNLGLYLHDTFKDFYEARDRLERDCKYDLVEDFIWAEMDE